MADNTIHGPNYQTATKSLKLDKKSCAIQQQQQQQQQPTTNVNAGLNPTTTTPTTSSNSPNQGLKKKTSFQITSVTVGSSRLSNDGGDDSADDLDESHTDDISRITDNETPSFSEDTLSRDEVVSNVIPTSAQYGLAILPEQVTAAATLPVVSSTPIAITPTTTTVTTTTTTILPAIGTCSVLSSMAPVTSVKSADICTSTLTPTPTQQTIQSVHQFDNSINQDLPVSYESVDSILEELVNNNQLNGLSSSPLKVLNTSPRSDSNMSTADVQPTRSERFKVVKIESTEPFRRGRWMCMDYLDHSVNQPHNSPFVKPVDSSLLNGGTAPAPPQTLPVPVQMQNGGTQHHPATITYQPVHQSPVNQQAPSEVASAATTSAITTTATSPTPTQQGQTYSGHPIVSSVGSSISSTGVPGPGTQAQTYAGQQIQNQLPIKVLYENELVSSSSSGTVDRSWTDLESSTASLMAYMQTTTQASPSTTMVTQTQSAPGVMSNAEATTTSTTLTRTPSLNNIVIATNTVPLSTVGALSPTIPMEPSHDFDLSNRILPLTGAVAGAVTSSSNSTPADPLAPSNPSLQVPNFQPAADDETASAASTVAIDNKIEQAMDLVKSHLMFAVREEVEVLKEKISELMDRINQLEVENSILKANATPDVLQQLPSPGTVIYTNPIPTTSVSTIVKSTPTSAS